MKKFEIHISYSWGDEESPIEIEKESIEEAFGYMIDLAIKELKTSLQEWNEPHNIRVYPNESKVTLWYGYDDENCYYKLVEMED